MCVTRITPPGHGGGCRKNMEQTQCTHRQTNIPRGTFDEYKVSSSTVVHHTSSDQDTTGMCVGLCDGAVVHQPVLEPCSPLTFFDVLVFLAFVALAAANEILPVHYLRIFTTSLYICIVTSSSSSPPSPSPSSSSSSSVGLHYFSAYIAPHADN